MYRAASCHRLCGPPGLTRSSYRRLPTPKGRRVVLPCPSALPFSSSTVHPAEAELSAVFISCTLEESHSRPTAWILKPQPAALGGCPAVSLLLKELVLTVVPRAAGSRLHQPPPTPGLILQKLVPGRAIVHSWPLKPSMSLFLFKGQCFQKEEVQVRAVQLWALRETRPDGD